MTPTVRTVIYPVSDLARATSVFSAVLGDPPVMNESYYVQFNADGQEIGLDPHGAKKGMTGPVVYWHVADIRTKFDELIGAGAQPQQPVQDVGGGRLIATVTDLDGNVIGLVQPS